jgi:flagellar protein FlbT
VRNGDKAALLFIENSVPILREKDIMKEEDATSAEQRLYFLIQLMYVDQDDLSRYLDLFQGQVTSLLHENPALEVDLVALTRLVGDRDYYNALKTARRLMQQPSD